MVIGEPARVGIVYPRATLDSTPLAAAAELLAEHGYDVDLLILNSAGQAPPRFASERIRLRWLGVDGLAHASASVVRGAVRRAGWLPRVVRRPLAAGYLALGAGLANGSRALARARLAVSRQPRPYCCLIGVDPDGLALAAAIGRGAPIAYYSFELLLSYELTTPDEQRLKAQERALSRQAAFVIVQDEQRGRLLAEDNGLDWERLVLVPNAPVGRARRAPSDYWHQRFGLAPDQRVVLHAGSLGDWTGIQAIVDSVATWPEPWVLVIHTRYDAESTPYVEELRSRSDPNRVRYSLKPVPRQEFDALVDGADVGLAFYVPSGDSSFTRRNIETIGLSSGKLAAYLRAGLPVITNAATSIAAQLEREGCGVVVEDAGGIAAALPRIEAGYATYSAGAVAFFERHLDFARSFQHVIERIDRLNGCQTSLKDRSGALETAR